MSATAGCASPTASGDDHHSSEPSGTSSTTNSGPISAPPPGSSTVDSPGGEPSGPSNTSPSNTSPSNTSPSNTSPSTPAPSNPTAPGPAPASDGSDPHGGGSGTADGTSSTEPLLPGALATFVCPAGPHASVPVLEGEPTELVAGFAPGEDFASATDNIVLEGPVWLEGRLYVSQINAGTPVFGRPGGFPQADADGGASSDNLDAGSEQPQRPPPSRLLALDASGTVSVVWQDAGTNGLALDASGRLLSANHRTGGITVVPIDGEPEANIVATYDGVRFNSPNDLTVGRDGTIYFTDPDYQAPQPAPQTSTRAYRIAPGTNVALPIVEERRQPNGITLSPNGETLYVSASDGLVAYPVSSDGAIGAGVAFAEGVVRSSDGMAVDCAGNLYTTSGQSVIVVDPAGVEVARIAVPDVQSVTNVAFGGEAHTTIYITTLGSGSRVGLFRLTGQVPGMPY